MEQTIILTVVLCAALYLFKTIRRAVHGHASGTGCCGKCGQAASANTSSPPPPVSSAPPSSPKS